MDARSLEVLHAEDDNKDDNEVDNKKGQHNQEDNNDQEIIH